MFYEGIQLGHYRLLRLIGRGGAGEVYLAEDQRIKRQVALKLVQSEGAQAESGKEAARLFQREAETIAMLSHPHILPLFDLGEEVVNGVTLAYLVTPFCSDGSLTTWIRHRQTTLVLAPSMINALVQQAADALRHAHEQGIIHRDVKPSNFLVRVRKDTPDRPDLLLADFGIARFVQATVNASKTIRGTPTYMAPEQWSSHAVPETDQYALAVMVYEFLTGQPPFQGTQEQMMYHHLMTQPHPPSTLNAEIAPSIDDVVLRALAKQPSDRFPSISGFAQAFQRAVTEPPPPFGMLGPSSPALRSPVETSDNTIRASTFLASTPIAEPASRPPVVEPVSRPPVRDTPHITPGVPQHDEVFTTLNISTTEAVAGVRCTLTLANKQKVKVTVPPGAHDGQVIRAKLPHGSTFAGSENSNIVVTLLVTPTIEPGTTMDIPGMSPSRIRWKLLALIAVVLVVLIGSIAGIFSFGTNQFASHFIAATAIASKGTIQAMQSNYATATAQAGVNATTTAQAVASAAVTNDPYDPSQQHLVLNEVLNQNSNAGWASRNGNCTFTTDNYHVASTGQATAPQVCTHMTSFGDMTFQVQMNILKGNGGGLLFRSTNASSYYFHISQDGNYALFLCAGTGTSCNKMLSGNFSSAITTGLNQQNVLAVVLKGNQIQLFINGEEVGTITDGTSLQGQIGVVADAHSEVVCNNAKVWTA
ncbi:MAG: hypothetical protein NVS4B11_10250 [Ktedonobacteraceae bacterium]